MIQATTTSFPTLQGEREFPEFDLGKLLSTVFDPIDGCKMCMLIDLDDPKKVKDFAFLEEEGYPVQKKAYEVFY
jgi:hypothetical protein